MTKPATTLDEMEQYPPHDESIGKKRYERELEQLQIELLKAQRCIKETGQRVVIVFEGRDAAVIGGASKRFREKL